MKTYIDSGGYRVTTIKHRYVHRLVMERHLGRPLQQSEHIHHKNHLKTDNRLSNLELLNASDHHRRHRRFTDEERLENRRRQGREHYWKYRATILPKMRKRATQYYWKNRDRILKYWKEFRTIYADKVRARKRRYYLANRKETLLKQSAYAKKKRAALRAILKAA